MNENGMYAAKMLKEHHPSDQIILDQESYENIITFRNKIVGSDTDNVSDVIWARTLPINDLELSLRNGMTVRVCIFEDAVEGLDIAPEGKTCMVGAIQEYGHKGFVIIGVVKGQNRTDISEEVFYKDGRVNGKVMNHEAYFEIMRVWHGIQIALLNPQVQDVFSSGDMVKKYTREDTETKKRQRVVRYIKRHVIDPRRLSRALTEYHRHCLAWYVIGHWRHYKDGRVIFIKPYWKGELRALKRNFDDRQREVVVK